MADDVELLQQQIMHGGERAFEGVPLMLRKVILEKQWVGRTDKDGKSFTSFEAFATHRLWQGLETTIADLRVFCRKHPEIERLVMAEVEAQPTHADAGAKGGRGKKASSNATGFTQERGATYTLKRLKRDRPDLFQQVLDGELSANKAAIEAGFRKPAPLPIQVILKLLAKLTRTELRHLRARIDELLDEKRAA